MEKRICVRKDLKYYTYGKSYYLDLSIKNSSDSAFKKRIPVKGDDNEYRYVDLYEVELENGILYKKFNFVSLNEWREMQLNEV